MNRPSPRKRRAESETEIDLSELLGGGDDDIACSYAPVIYLHGEITAAMAKKFIRAVDRYMENNADLIMLDIASEGGSLFALNQMLSVMDGSSAKFATYCSSHAFSAAAVLLSAGDPGLRFISPHGCAMIHSILYATDFQGIEEHTAEADFNNRLNDRLLNVLAKNMKTTVAKLKKRIKATGIRNLWLLPEESLEINLVDTVGIPSVRVTPSINLQAVVTATKTK